MPVVDFSEQSLACRDRSLLANVVTVEADDHGPAAARYLGQPPHRDRYVKMVPDVADENRLGGWVAAFRFFQPLETDGRQERDCPLKITAQLRRIVVLIRPLVEVALLVPLIDRYAPGQDNDADRGG